MSAIPSASEPAIQGAKALPSPDAAASDQTRTPAQMTEPTGPADGPTRRRVLAGTALAAGGTVVLSACGGSQDSGGKDALDHPVDIAATEDVPVGGSLSASADGVNALITQPTAGQFKAFSSVCTHQGCTVKADDAQLTCPCHSSVFSIQDGSVQSGPAGSPLPEYKTTVSGGRITISS